MDTILKTIGAMVVAGIIIAIPILLPISFIYHWNELARLLLITATCVVFGFIVIAIACISYCVEEM